MSRFVMGARIGRFWLPASAGLTTGASESPWSQGPSCASACRLFRHPRMSLAGTHVMLDSRLRGNDDWPTWQHPAGRARLLPSHGLASVSRLGRSLALPSRCAVAWQPSQEHDRLGVVRPAVCANDGATSALHPRV